MRRLFGCPDIVSLTEKFLMARNFYRIFTENNPVMGDSKTFGIPEAKAKKNIFCCCYETMSNCSQNCWIDWNSAVPCFKQLFHIGVKTFTRFVRCLLATILCLYNMGNLVPVYTVHVSHIPPPPFSPSKKIKKIGRLLGT